MSGSSPERPALAHIEKTLADSYRKEIDQEENIWRSLPFFVATLALQLASLFQIIERIPSGSTWPTIVAYCFAALAAGCSLGALGYLIATIFPSRFRYLAKDSELLAYALGLIEDEQQPANQALPVPLVALHVLKRNLAEQYALATDNNRRINKRRESRRSVAGLLTLFSAVCTLLLVIVTFATYVVRHEGPDDSHGLSRQNSAGRPGAASQRERSGAAPAAADAGGD